MKQKLSFSRTSTTTKRHEGSHKFSRTSTTTKRHEGFHKYLKPGTLAKLRDTKITATSQRHHQHDLKTMNSLYQLLLSSSSIASSFGSSQSGTYNQSDHGGPHFPLPTVNRPRCLQRKKLVAVKPVFSDN